MKVQILMSVYNSVQFFREQLDSVLSQIGVTCDLLIRDDGAENAETDAIINEYQTMYPGRITYYKGVNLRPALSFIDLIKHSSEDYDYYAFCDHDDLWDEDKMLNAVNALKALDEKLPNCYFCNYRMCDESGKTIGKSNLPQYDFMPKANNLLLCNPAPGCCMVFNNRARLLIAENKAPKNLVMHDCWLIMLCATVGKVIYDPIPHISYRQHSNNAIGVATNIRQKIRFKIKYSFDKQNRFIHQKQCREFCEQYGLLIQPENKRLLERISSCDRIFVNRLKLLFDKKFTSYSFKTTLYFKLCLMFGAW